MVISENESQFFKMPNIIAASGAMPKYGHEFSLSGTRVSMIQPTLSYTRSTVPAALFSAPLTVQKIVPQQPAGCPPSQQNLLSKNTVPHADPSIYRTTPTKSNCAAQFIRHQLQLRNSQQNNVRFPKYLEENLRRLSIHSSAHSAKRRISVSADSNRSDSAKRLPITPVINDIQISPEVTSCSEGSPRLYVPRPPNTAKREEPFSPRTQRSNSITSDCQVLKIERPEPERVNDLAQTEGKDGDSSLTSAEQISVAEDDEDGASLTDSNDERGQSKSCPTVKCGRAQSSTSRKKKSRWKSGRRSSRQKNNRSRRIVSKVQASPRTADCGVPHASVRQIEPRQSNLQKIQSSLQAIRGVNATNNRLSITKRTGIRENQTSFSVGTFSLTKPHDPFHHKSHDKSHDISPPVRSSHPGGGHTLRLREEPPEPKITKVYLSQAQAKLLTEMGMSVPSAPPATPVPELLNGQVYIPCLYDVMAQRSLKTQLENMALKELKKREKAMEEKMKVDKQQMKVKEKAIKQRQRKEIYALNKIMTELENKNFETFIATYGLNVKTKSAKSKK